MPTAIERLSSGRLIALAKANATTAIPISTRSTNADVPATYRLYCGGPPARVEPAMIMVNAQPSGKHHLGFFHNTIRDIYTPSTSSGPPIIPMSVELRPYQGLLSEIENSPRNEL